MLRSPVTLLMCTVGIVGSNSLVLSPIAAAVAMGIGLTEATDVLSAMALYGLAVAFSAVIFAPLVDRFGADRALKVALLIMTLALAVTALANTLFILIAAQTIAGLAAGVALPATYALAAHLAPKGREAQVIGRVLTGWTLSMAGGVTLSAWITDFAGWRMVYVLLAVGLAFATLGITRLRLETAPARGQVTSPLRALRLPEVIPGLFAVLMLGGGFYGIYNYLGAHLERNMGLQVSDAGLLTLSYGLGFALSMLADPYLDKVGPRRGLIAVFSCLAIFYATLTTVDLYYTGLLVGVFFWGMFQHAGLTLTVSRLTAIDPSQRGAILGLNSMIMYLSVFGATLVFRPGFEWAGLKGCMYLSAGLAVLGALEATIARLRQVQNIETA
ncbi:MFS transporter [Halocynthiibacter styelae]|uniref:MFS transporter n=1 Tax=Halocynthiibacter styelae TaxID=2761955 RepID=A0A8J7ID31_9RHOB|nr:MFS transporter [Paenihalocynthiibacter styelae]MBI1492102.1 MFS transporter [Paenihalocynthiibacter styelae]